jgi:hypothetical protein
MRGQPVVGEHRARVDVVGELGAALDRLCVRLVQPAPLPREKVVVNRGSGQFVAKAIPAPGPVHHQQLLGHRLAQRGVQVCIGELRHGRQQTIGHPPRSRRDGSQHVLAVVGERLDAPKEDVTERRGEVVLVNPASENAAEPACQRPQLRLASDQDGAYQTWRHPAMIANVLRGLTCLTRARPHRE